MFPQTVEYNPALSDSELARHLAYQAGIAAVIGLLQHVAEAE